MLYYRGKGAKPVYFLNEYVPNERHIQFALPGVVEKEAPDVEKCGRGWDGNDAGFPDSSGYRGGIFTDLNSVLKELLHIYRYPLGRIIFIEVCRMDMNIETIKI